MPAQAKGQQRRAMTNKGHPPKSNIVSKAILQIRIKHELSKEINITKGVLQGKILSL